MSERANALHEALENGRIWLCAVCGAPDWEDCGCGEFVAHEVRPESTQSWKAAAQTVEQARDDLYRDNERLRAALLACHADDY